MLRDSFEGPPEHPRIQMFRAIVPTIQFFLAEVRKLGGLIVFANDSYFKGDFLFRGKMPPHAVRGSAGAEVIDELKISPEDIILPKRRFSAFFKTDLDITLRTLEIDTIAVAGLTTEICVLATGPWTGFAMTFTRLSYRIVQPLAATIVTRQSLLHTRASPPIRRFACARRKSFSLRRKRIGFWKSRRHPSRAGLFRKSSSLSPGLVRQTYHPIAGV